MWSRVQCRQVYSLFFEFASNLTIFPPHSPLSVRPTSSLISISHKQNTTPALFAPLYPSALFLSGNKSPRDRLSSAMPWIGGYTDDQGRPRWFVKFVCFVNNSRSRCKFDGQNIFNVLETFHFFQALCVGVWVRAVVNKRCKIDCEGVSKRCYCVHHRPPTDCGSWVNYHLQEMSGVTGGEICRCKYGARHGDDQ